MADRETTPNEPTVIAPVPDALIDGAPDVVGTPEGDNEYAPDQPLKPTPPHADAGLEVPRGSAPNAYKGEV